MATRNITREITVEDFTWGLIYEGPRDELVAAGLADPSKFPGDPGNRKTIQRYRVGEREVSIQKAGRKGLFSVSVSYSEEEQRLRYAAAEAQREREGHQRDLDALPASGADFLGRLERIACSALGFVEGYARNGEGGYRLSDESMVDVLDAMGELVAAIRDSRAVLDKGKRAEQVERIRAKIAQAAPRDPAFGQFLDRVMAPTEDGDATA